MAEETLVGRNSELGVLDLTTLSLTTQLPHQLTHLGDRLGRNRFTKARQTTAGVHRNPATDSGRTRSQQAFSFARSTQAKVFVPIKFERSRQVVHLGHRQILWTHSGLFVSIPTNGIFESTCWGHNDSRRVGCKVGHF